MSPTLVPPGVCGRVRGSIDIAIDEVFWSGTPQSDVYVKFNWWGSEEFYEFFPRDLTQVGGADGKNRAADGKNRANDKPTSYTFPVGTSLKFLEDYFRKWGSINFNVYRLSDKRLLGSARVENWECILSDARYGSYFAITDKKDNRIGDLHIVFTLKMKKKKYKLKSDFPIIRDAPLTSSWDKDKSGELLTDLLSKGQQLRKAMVKSVLSSCETKDLDEVVASEAPPVSVAPVLAEKQCEAKLVDFLMGKELSEPDKEIAINTLRCTSPSESVLEVAANFTDHSKFRETNKGHTFEDSYQKRFCSVGDNKSVGGDADGPSSPRGPSTRFCDREAPETHYESPDHEVLDKAYPVYGNDKKIDDSSVNSYRVSFSVLTLTALGLKKVSTSPTIKPLSNRIRPAKSPGIVFSIETMMPFTPKSKTTFLKPVTMSSKAFGGNDAVFNESVVRKLRRSNERAWIKVGHCIAGLPVKIYWRCLNQRLPSLLGQCMLPDDLESEDFEANYQLQVYMANRQVAAILSCKIELGCSGVFGNGLLGKRKNKKKSLFESMVPQISDVPPSRDSTGSAKSFSQNSKDSIQIPAPPPTARCRTASSNASNACREPVESDQQLLDAISCLNEKLTKKVVLSEKAADGAPESISNPEPAERSRPTSARVVEPGQPETSSIPAETPKDAPDAGGDKNCRHRSPRGCCCCCRGCHGDCKRKKSLRRKHLRDRHHPSRGSEAKRDESSALSNTDGDMSPEDRARLDVHSRLREPRFHSPPTRLNRKPKNFEQVSKPRDREAGDLPDRLDSLYRDAPRGRAGDFPRSHNVPSDLYKPDLEPDDKFLPRSPSELPSVHRFVVNVYSSDAHVFYREGELELYMVYRFPQVDPVSGKLFCPAEISTVELSGDGAPVTHYLPLRTPLSKALLSYPKHNITFHIWARAYLYEKRDFLIGQAKLPLEKLVEWEAAHIYSQKRRIDHPMLPPDKHFINLRIHPAKGELPQHLEPGRIAQLGLEIDYEKFRDATNAFDAWPLNSTGSPSGPPYHPTSQANRDEVTDSSDPYLNFKHSCGTAGFNEVSKGQRFCSTNARPSVRDDEEFMLILDGRGEHNRTAFGKTDDRSANLPDHQVPDGDPPKGVWEDDHLQFQSFSRMDPANTTEFVPDDGLRAQLLSPRVDRDFPPGVRTADFSSDNNSDRQHNPFDAPVTVHHQPRPCANKSVGVTPWWDPSTVLPGPADHLYETRLKPQEARIRVADQSSPLPSLAKVIDPNFRARVSSPDANLDSSYDLGSDSKATQTTVNEQNSPKLFSVRIEVESAINLPPVRKNGVLTKPSSRIEFDAWNKGKEIIVQSSVVNEDSNPKYDSAWNVDLPTHLLYKGDSELELRVVNVDDGSISSAFIDLTTLSAGLPSIDGWYFLSSHGHKSAGQVKVTITPMESIRKYRDVWIEECRKTKEGPQNGRRDDRLSCESAQKMMLNDSSSTKFKEKMKELEQLTERMKKKLLAVDRWDSTSPCTLMRDVDDFAKQLLQEVEGPAQTSQTQVHANHTAQSRGLPELNLSTVQHFCPVENDLESPQRDSVINIDDSPLPAPHEYATSTVNGSRDILTAPCYGSHDRITGPGQSRIRKPRRPLSNRSSNRVNILTNGLTHDEADSPEFGLSRNPDFGSESPVNLISFDDSPDERRSHTYSLPSNSNDTSPTSPVNAFIREENETLGDSDDSGAVARAKLSLEKCHEELERLPRNSLDAASLAIEKIIADIRNHNADDPKS